jgi:hypothetical protein
MMISLCGDRDSEIAAVVHDPELANDLRKKLFTEHLGSSDIVTNDFLRDWRKWRKYSDMNTKLYKNLFGKSTPLGEPRTAIEYTKSKIEFRKQFVKSAKKGDFTQIRTLEEELGVKIHGHVVNYPRHFLQETVLNTKKMVGVNPYNVAVRRIFDAIDHVFQ